MNPGNIYKSIFLEISSIAVIIFSKTFPSVLAFFILHGLASFLISQIIISLMPANYKKKYLFNLFFMTVLNTATLFLGYAASFYLATVLLRKQKMSAKYDICSIDSSQLMLFPSVKRELGEGSASLSGKKIPKEIKLKIMETFSKEITPESIKIIKNLLTDEDYEIRLYSFQALNSLKNEINLKINEALNELEKEKDNFKKAQINKKLALFYFDMFDLELSEESLSDFFIERSLYHLNLAEEFMGDGELLFIKAKIMNIKGEKLAAIDFFNKAVKYGIDEHMAYPLIAEIYFELKNYQKVREILSKDFSIKLDFHTKPIADIWEAHIA
ncbi:MAG: hypothetical protein K6357_03795 [Elusimicrobiota bacterium]